VNFELAPGPDAGPADQIAGLQRHRFAQEELSRIRGAALAWRNGVAGLLVGLVGFGLIKGRTDIGELARPFSAVVGLLLATALISGVAAALCLLRAAHGPPAAFALSEVAGIGPGKLIAGIDHAETVRAVRALRSGLAVVLVSATLLATAVAVTWYGPARSGPQLEVLMPGARYCGEVVGLNAGRLTLRTATGGLTVNLGQAVAIQAVAACSGDDPGPG
jgi:hypothetical protein